MDLMSIRRRLLRDPDLPPMYRRVEYLQGKGNQLISTGINCESGLTAKYKIAFTRTDAVQQVCAAIGDTKRIYFPYNSGNGVWAFAYGSGGATTIRGVTIGADVPYTVEVTAEAGNQSVIIDGQECYTGLTGDYINIEKNLWLFASNNSNGALRCAYAKIYTFSLLKSSTGELLVNFIPCVRQYDSKPGMYDTVSRTFKTNATGTGEFAVPA